MAFVVVIGVRWHGDCCMEINDQGCHRHIGIGHSSLSTYALGPGGPGAIGCTSHFLVLGPGAIGCTSHFLVIVVIINSERTMRALVSQFVIGEEIQRTPPCLICWLDSPARRTPLIRQELLNASPQTLGEHIRQACRSHMMAAIGPT